MEHCYTSMTLNHVWSSIKITFAYHASKTGQSCKPLDTV